MNRVIELGILSIVICNKMIKLSYIILLEPDPLYRYVILFQQVSIPAHICQKIDVPVDKKDK